MRSVPSRRSEPSTAKRMLFSSSRVPRPSGRIQALDPRPLTLLAITSRARPPRRASQEPTMRSVSPCVPARGGIGYISAVSMKLTPRATARSSWA